VIIGAVGGLIAFSHILSWVFRKFRDETISILTGFILGSVSILWPWQKANYLVDKTGELIYKEGGKVITHYSRYIPEELDSHFWFAIAWIIIGILVIWGIEKLAVKKS
jgi:putative membrane protein